MVRYFFPFLFVVLVYSFDTLGQKAELKSASDQCREIHQDWLRQVFKITQNTVGFSAPVAARAYAYLSIGMYESSVEIMPGNKSLTGQLNGYNRTVWAHPKSTLSYSFIANQVDFKMIEYMYQNMPNEYRELVNEHYTNNLKHYFKSLHKKVRNASAKYADSLVQEIINWSKLDGANAAYNKNFPTSYIAPKCESCWVQTFPGYFPALQPYWGNNRYMVKSNSEQCNDIPVLAFSKDSSSTIYKESTQLFNLEIDSEKERIAEFWDDSPGYSRTPSGHFYEISSQLANTENLSLSNLLQLYVTIGIAINDAMINTWKLKYEINLLRPITYIERYIGKGYNTLIPTPPFPEFPSGHSFQSGAGTEVLKHFFTDNYTFIDSTHIDRVDIDGSPRKFNSFSEMSEEISISRFYGGIHFPTTLKTSLIYGRKIGQNTINTLKFKK